MSEDIRWNGNKDFLTNYKKAIMQLTEFIEKESLNKFEIQGLIHCFGYTFQLAWKTMKDYLQLEGFEVISPRETIQTAFQMQLIKDGHVWIDALNKRNLMAHTYNEGVAKEAEQLIKEKYYQVIRELLSELKKMI